VGFPEVQGTEIRGLCNKQRPVARPGTVVLVPASTTVPTVPYG